MLLHNILHLKESDEIFLAEESLADLITLPVTRDILSEGLDADRYIDVQGYGFAAHMIEPAEFWLLLTDRYSPDKILTDYAQRGQGRGAVNIHGTASTNDADFIQALIEYYAIFLCGEFLCDSCSVFGPPLYNEDRIKRLESLLEPLPKGMKILEVCCGNGMGTQALLKRGYAPWAMELDRCDLCQALKSGSMDPRRSFVLDAKLLGYFFTPESFDAVIGFMMGLIDRANWPLWKNILLISSSLARDRVLYTVYSRNEAELIAQALDEEGFQGEIIDNRDLRGSSDEKVPVLTMYDQFAYLGRRIA
ncbi:MAG: hypothetical protein ACE14P_10300 [Methanotrichaceae archaeon]